MPGFHTFQHPNTATSEVAVVQQVQIHLDLRGEAGELLVVLHDILNEDSFFDTKVKVSCSIFMEIIFNVLGLWNPWKFNIIQLDRGKQLPVGAIECQAHSLAFLRISVCAEHQIVLLSRWP